MKRLVLVGAGHAHLEVLRRLARRPLADTEVVLVNPAPIASYTGMVPGWLRGAYSDDEVTVPLAPLCAAANGWLLEEPAVAVDGGARTVRSATRTLAFDAASVDVGGNADWQGVPGAAEHAVALRPLANAAVLRRRVDAAPGLTVAVVGAGAGGVEIALALHRRITDRGARPRLTIVDADALLPGHPPRARAIVRRLLEARGVVVRTGTAVASVDATGIALGDGTRVEAAVVAWATGVAPPALLDESALPRSGDGWFSVDATLRATDGVPVWGAGDCVAVRGFPWLPRAGVHAVRAAPTLAHNLRAALEPRAARGPSDVRTWRPRRRVLALLDTADGRALLRYGDVTSYGRAEAWLKARIDRRWIARFAVARGTTASSR